MRKFLFTFIQTVFIVSFSCSLFAQNRPQSESILKLKKEIDSGQIVFKLTEVHEIRDILGNPDNEKTHRDGGMSVLELNYPEIEIFLAKYVRDVNAPFTLFAVKINGQFIDIGRNRKITLRSNRDLSKLDDFIGFQNVSLKNVDLREELELVRRMSFDNLTEWPSKELLPPDFDPLDLLKTHKTPGLNIKKLHADGITGKGIGMAIIDQPLLLGHEEYTSQIFRYEATGLLDLPPQMHGSPIVSIAVGKNIGVAPEASLSYFAVPMWENDNQHYIQTLDKIIKLNEILPNNEKIKVVSISDGSFPSKPHYAEIQKIFKKAEEMGILIVNCDPEFLDYGTLNTIAGQDPDNIDNYTKGRYTADTNVLLVPAGNRTLASHMGVDVYVFDREGGRSWAAPYIAGLAALAFQVNPNTAPLKIKKLLIKTAAKTLAGPVINPTEFIESVKKE
ncbi:S8/S53 family peptidase [candidate division KSB1 bacterium]|nr:S8/S53 family peptidase [candidate division KSB1 bacterium]